jgi:DNA-binding SARP family transcriptional activator
MLNVTLLGGASFSVNGTLLRSDLGPAGRLLACYLFEFNGRMHRRERLADLFWSGIDPDRARSAMNTAIWRIRKILELGSKGAALHLVTIGDDVILEPSQTIQIDTHMLQNASKKMLGRTEFATLDDGDIQAIRRAVDGYAGPFMDGYDDDWVLQERERLHCLFVRSAVELMRTATMQGQYEVALDFGRRILATDPLRESIQREVMLLLALNGQRVEAIRTYQRLMAPLKSELGIEPMPDTKQLYSDIVSGAIFGGANSAVIRPSSYTGRQAAYGPKTAL